jgi:hypothetical protein
MVSTEQQFVVAAGEQHSVCGPTAAAVGALRREVGLVAADLGVPGLGAR